MNLLELPCTSSNPVEPKDGTNMKWTASDITFITKSDTSLSGLVGGL